eukprot:358020-Chlamydomonas_euryale.AAC.9
MATERQMRSMLHSSSVSAVGSTTVRNGLMGPSGGTTDACADADADVISLQVGVVWSRCVSQVASKGFMRSIHCMGADEVEGTGDGMDPKWNGSGCDQCMLHAV